VKMDIFTCKSQQPSTMIWPVTRELQHANHEVMGIHTTRMISYDSQGIYTLRSRSRMGESFQADLTQKDCKYKIALEVLCNLCKLVNFLSPPSDFSQFGFSHKISCLSLLFMLKSLLSSYKRDNSNSLWYEVDHLINRPEKLQHKLVLSLRSESLH